VAGQISGGGLVPLAERDKSELQAENRRLRDALTKIAWDAYTREDEKMAFTEPTMIWQSVARKALEHK
jgi:hypothetical protein